MLEGKICSYCSQSTDYIDSIEIYGKSYGMVYLCRPCDAFVGVHKGTDKAKGSVANYELREVRKQAHRYFDQLWKRKMFKENLTQKYARNKAYKWLAETMEIDRKCCHIGMMDLSQCKQVIEICKPYFKK